MDLGRPTTTTEGSELIGMVQYYRDVCPRRSHILPPLKEADSRHKVREIIWKYAIENSFKELKSMASAENLLSFPYWTIHFMVHTDASDKQLGAVISYNNKPIAFLSRRPIKPQRNYTTTKKELLAIVECLKQFRVILIGYEINIFSYHKKSRICHNPEWISNGDALATHYRMFWA